MPKKARIPSYRLHKQSGKAIVTLPDGNGGRNDIILGEYDSPESWEVYARSIAEWKANQKVRSIQKAPDITMNELILGFWEFGKEYFGFGQKPRKGYESCFKDALRIAKELYGSTCAKDFGPLALKACRAVMVEKGWSRNYVNAQTERIRRVFQWASEEELVPGTQYVNLRSVAALRAGKTASRETPKILPVSDHVIEQTLPFLSETVQAIVQFQRLTGCRPDEACSIRPCDLDMANPDCWVFRLDKHKTAHHGHKRLILIGPQAQNVLRPFLGTKIEGYCFSPACAEEARNEDRKRKRKTPMTPSQRKRAMAAARRKRKRPPEEKYQVTSVRNAIYRACDMAFPPGEPIGKRKGETVSQWLARLTSEQKAELSKWKSEHRWHPNQLRHNRATELRKHGLDVVKTVLGHSKVETSQIYAEKDLARAMELVAEIG